MLAAGKQLESQHPNRDSGGRMPVVDRYADIQGVASTLGRDHCLLKETVVPRVKSLANVLTALGLVGDCCYPTMIERRCQTGEIPATKVGSKDVPFDPADTDVDDQKHLTSRVGSGLAYRSPSHQQPSDDRSHLGPLVSRP